MLPAYHQLPQESMIKTASIEVKNHLSNFKNQSIELHKMGLLGPPIDPSMNQSKAPQSIEHVKKGQVLIQNVPTSAQARITSESNLSADAMSFILTHSDPSAFS